MKQWQDSEVRELLLIQGDEEIKTKITSTAGEPAIYKKMLKCWVKEELFADKANDKQIKSAEEKISCH